jgi:hypothetical protein
VSLIPMTPQDGGVPMTTLTRRTKHLVGPGPDCLLAATGWGEA